MVVAKNSGQTVQEFEQLLEDTVEQLLIDVKSSKEREHYYLTRTAQKLETDVYNYMVECAKGTPFEGSIRIESGQRFPDIVANDYFGVEVKTTKGDKWRSTGNSVLESTRVDNIEKIYLLFGKLSSPIGFRFKKYEDCLVDVAVTHAPRYLIDMDISREETIFSKINLSYDEIRVLDNPAKPLLTHYRETLGDDSSVWWLDIGEESAEEAPVSPLKITPWRTLPKEKRNELIVLSFIYFPEILSSSQTKFTRLAVWLIKTLSIVNPSLRDAFSASGTDVISLKDRKAKVPQIMKKLQSYSKQIYKMLEQADVEELQKHWGIKFQDEDKLQTWLNLASVYGDSFAKKYDTSVSIKEIFESGI